MTIALFIPNILLLYSNIKSTFMNYNSIIRNIFFKLLEYFTGTLNLLQMHFDSIIVVINVESLFNPLQELLLFNAWELNR